ncbi:hypothetical protein R1flu_002306 [Riccia fluitans]|uniref:Uncharacterized protein n=1 Tax=Riccia fluitans TaxID=41844 RepID=A0ABD1Y5Q3_9MARC
MENNKEQQMTAVKEEVKVLARSSSCNDESASKKQSILERTLSPRKPKFGKPPKFRTLERSASAAVAKYEAEIAKKVDQQTAPKPGSRRLERLSKFRFKSGHLDFDISSIRV